MTTEGLREAHRVPTQAEKSLTINDELAKVVESLSNSIRGLEKKVQQLNERRGI